MNTKCNLIEDHVEVARIHYRMFCAACAWRTRSPVQLAGQFGKISLRKELLDQWDNVHVCTLLHDLCQSQMRSQSEILLELLLVVTNEVRDHVKYARQAFKCVPGLEHLQLLVQAAAKNVAIIDQSCPRQANKGQQPAISQGLSNNVWGP